MKTKSKAKTAKTKLTKRKAPVRRTKPQPKSGLSGFLVIWRHTMDDIPLGLFAKEEDAVKFAKKFTWPQGYAIAKRLDIDCSTPVCVAYVAFTYGVPGEFTFVQRPDDA